MNVLFLTMVSITTLKSRGIYHDLLNHFKEKGHNVYIVSPTERRHKKGTSMIIEDNASILNVKTLNLTKSNIIEKGIGQLFVEYQYLNAIKKYYSDVKFDLLLYSTPPITFSRIIQFIKKRDNAYAYLLLKDIFPQNAVDMGIMKKNGLMHKYFMKKEKKLYSLSDTIGCMSLANQAYLLTHNPGLSPSKVEVNPNSIKPQTVVYDKQEKDTVKQKYNIPLGKKIFIYGGNLGVPQGVDFLLETLAVLEEPEAHFVIVGSGTQFAKIKQWFEVNEPKNATLLSGMPKEEYDALLGACDIGLIFLDKAFAVPNFPSRLLSYLEMKMPVLAATDSITDIGSIIEDAGCGYWVQAGDMVDMKDKIRQLCSDDLQVKGENAWKLLQNNYLVSRSYNLIKEKIKP